jgi:lysozyme family protein
LRHCLVSRNVAGPEVPQQEDNFPACLAFVLAHEGGVSARSKRDDPGGLTNLGITEGTLDDFNHDHPDEGLPGDVRELTQEQATYIYRVAFWNEIDGDDLPAPIALVVFNAAVQSGPTRASRWLQLVLDVKVDGIIGPNTKRAAKMANARKLVSNFLKIQLFFEMELSNWMANKGGWANRLFDVSWVASEMNRDESTNRIT